MKYIKLTLTILIAFIIFAMLDTSIGRRFSQANNFDSPYIKETNETNMDRFRKTVVDYSDPDPKWNPTEQFGTANQPEISGTSGLVIDITSNKILFDKNATQKLKIASLTKIMTAIIALEHKNLAERIQVDQDATSIGENSMGISEGEIYTLEELMYGLLLPSGNDAAIAIAKGTAGSVKNFVEWMNYKAKELGLNDTYFADPSGLDDANTSTAFDLVKLTRYAMQNQKFREFVKTDVKFLSNTNTHKYLELVNQTNLLTSYPGVAGVKTGYTEEAGLCLVTYANNGGHELIGVVLKSTDRKGDMILMLDHSFGTVGVQIEHDLL